MHDPARNPESGGAVFIDGDVPERHKRDVWGRCGVVWHGIPRGDN